MNFIGLFLLTSVMCLIFSILLGGFVLLISAFPTVSLIGLVAFVIYLIFFFKDGRINNG